MSAGRNRFYKDVSVRPSEAGYAVLLDGKPIKTPAGAAFAVPTGLLADAVAEEWRAQGKTIQPETMLLTKLANAAIDRVVGPNRGLAAEQVLAFARSDLVCYRADTPSSLVERQAREWDALLEWVRSRHGAALKTVVGISYVQQPPDALAALERALTAHDDFALAGLHAAATLMGSAVIALALLEGRLNAEEAFAASHLDEVYQAEKWGRDAEAERVSLLKASELIEIARFLTLLRQP